MKNIAILMLQNPSNPPLVQIAHWKAQIVIPPHQVAMLHMEALKLLRLQIGTNTGVLRLRKKRFEIDRFVCTIVKVDVQLVVRLIICGLYGD